YLLFSRRLIPTRLSRFKKTILNWLPDRKNINHRHLAMATTAVVLAVAIIAINSFNGQVKAASYTIDGQAILKGYADFNQLDRTKDGTISLQRGNIGQWHGYDGMPSVEGRGQYYDSRLVYGPNRTLYYIGYGGSNCRFDR